MSKSLLDKQGVAGVFPAEGKTHAVKRERASGAKQISNRVGRSISGDDADDEDFVSPLGIYLKDKIGFLSDINITGTLECVLLL